MARSLTARFHYFIGSFRRKRGLYDPKTLEHLQKAASPAAPPNHHICYARFQRDIEGAVSERSLKKLYSFLNQQITETSRSRIEAILSEARNIEWSPTHKPSDTNKKNAFSLKDFYNNQKIWRDQLSDFLKGKSIAVVGNSSSLVNSENGSSIDEHEVICRFNRYPTGISGQRDIGARTDIWIASAEVLNENRPIDPSVSWIVISGGDARYTLSNWTACIKHLSAGIRVVTIPLDVWHSLVLALKSPPSAGLLWLSYLSKTGASKPIEAYGFDTAKAINIQYHIASTKMRRSSRHAWAKEKKLLSRLESSDCISINKPTRYAAFTRGLATNKTLRRHLRIPEVIYKPNSLNATTVDAVIGWGRKPNTVPAIAYAKKHCLPFISLEDGFIHSMSQGRLGATSWSLVIDREGIYYDATKASDLEKLISTTQLTSQQHKRAKANISKITNNHITKYNNASLSPLENFCHFRNPVLILDQVAGDMSIPYALSNNDTFQYMFSEALRENPDSDVLVKRHPDVINGRRKGCLELPRILPKNVHLIDTNINPLVLMANVHKVYVVSSQAGFEALLLGKEVICFGAPFYAGWGLTSDRFKQSLSLLKRRKHRPDIYSIFFAAYILYSHYLHPVTNKPCEIEDVLDHVKRQHQHYQLNKGKFICIGLTPWKKKFITYYLQGSDSIRFIKSSEKGNTLGYDSQVKLLIWSNNHLKTAKNLATESGAKIYRVEDGFLRSVNLGSNYAPPSSLVIDSKGIYFDPSTESDLEAILNNWSFDSSLLERAEKLKKKIITLGISKYNNRQKEHDELSTLKKGKKVILVPGQVADDESIRMGCVDLTTNLDLLKAVRDSNNDAYIVYKPHPDVVSSNRSGRIPTELALKYCDIVIEDQSISACLEVANEVHTLTSLVGFEALLRNITVHCYGIPFYSGWGLTHDLYKVDRRKRSLSVDELTAATLILYPKYIDWETFSYTTPEQIVDKLYFQSVEASHVQPPSLIIHKLSLMRNLFRALIKPTFG